MECPFSSRCLGESELSVTIFEIAEMFLETDFDRSSSLSNIFLVACGACYLVDCTVFVCTFSTMMSCRQKFFNSVASRKRNFNIGILEYVGDSSCLFADVCKLSPLYFSCVLFLFLFETQVS